MPAATPLSSPYLSHSDGIAKYEVVAITRINPTTYAIKFKKFFLYLILLHTSNPTEFPFITQIVT